MAIKTRFSISADGYVTTPEGWPSLSADPAFVPVPIVTDSDPERLLEKVRAANHGRDVHLPEEARPVSNGAVDVVDSVAR
jgi:hypothetical protein